MIARITSMADVDSDLIPLGKLFFDDVKYPGEYQPLMLREFFEGLLKNGNGAIWIQYANKLPVGLMVSMLVRDFVNGWWNAHEVFWFVMPGSRGNGLLLFDEFERWAKSCGANRMVSGYKPASPRAFESFFIHRGYSIMETYYSKLCQ